MQRRMGKSTATKPALLLLLGLVGITLLLASWQTTTRYRNKSTSDDDAGKSGPAPATAVPTLFFALSYQETAESIRARSDRYNLATASRDQKLTMVRARSKTEIYAVNLVDGTRRLAFTDEGPTFEVRPDGEQALIVEGEKAYSIGVEREWRTGPSPGIFAKATGIYELSLDGSNRHRKLVELDDQNAQCRLFAKPAGEQLAYMTGEWGRETVTIVDIATGALSRRWDARKWATGYCSGANLGRLGWMPDGKSVFLTLVASPDEEPLQEGSGCDKAYLLTENGEDLRLAPVDSLRSPLAALSIVVRPFFIGRSTDGRDVFVVRKGGSPNGGASSGNWVVLSFDEKRGVRQIAFEREPYDTSFWLSSSGRHLAFLHSRLTKNYRSEMHLWVKDLSNGTEREWMKLEPVPVRSPAPIMYLYILGISGRP